MELIKGVVEWNEGWANDPNFKILVDKLPPREDLRYEKKGFIYAAELAGNVNFFAYARPDRGYGGREFPIVMKDGSDMVLKGPWSGNEMQVNAKKFDFGNVVEVTMTDEEDVWSRGYTFMAGSVTVNWIKQYFDQIDRGEQFKDGKLELLEFDGNMVICIRYADGSCYIKNEEKVKNRAGIARQFPDLSGEQLQVIG